MPNPSTPERSAREYLQKFIGNHCTITYLNVPQECITWDKAVEFAESYCSSRLAAERERLAQKAYDEANEMDHTLGMHCQSWRRKTAAWLRSQS